MAELFVSLVAEPVVSLAIERITDLLIHEAGSLRGVTQDVENLKTELSRMKSFLIDVDGKMEKDKRLQQRVAEIRDLAYNAEDVIDSYILEVENQGGFSGINKFASIFTKPSRLHEIGKQIKAIQSQLANISKNNPSYSIPGEGQGSTSSSSASEMLLQRLRRTYSHVEEEDIVTLENSMKDVLSQLMTKEDRPHAVVSIVGMGGIGKTTLAKKIYNHPDVKQHFDCLAWVYVSQQCNPREILHDVLIKFQPPSATEDRNLIDRLEEPELVRRVFNVLKEKRYLVVLDDIWKSDDWSCLKPAFPRGKKGSKILFTTRIMDVALLARPYNSPIQLPFLDDDQSWVLLKKKAFPRYITESDARFKEFEMLGRELVRKCRGLPLAIVVLGGLLATKDSPADWEMVHRNIDAHFTKLNQDSLVNGILALSYHDLPYYLKPCFLYLAHYPEDWEISKEELIQLWIAEGFILPSLECGETLMEDVAERFLEELINRCLVQVGQMDHTGTDVETCRIHDLLRDSCVEKAQKENFLAIIHPPIDDADHVTLNASMQRRIAVHPSKKYVCLDGKHPRLRSLLLFQECESQKGFDILKYSNFNLLKVLTLMKSGWRDWHLSENIGNLHHLRYLRLQCDGKIILPRSIGKLKYLHTLRIGAGEGLQTAPDLTLFKMERLRHIIIPYSRDLKLPSTVLKNVQTLKCIGVENLIEHNAVPNLPNIRVLQMLVPEPSDVGAILKSLTKPQRLRSLVMDIYSETVTFPVETLSECRNLSELFIRGKLQEDPRSNLHVLNSLPANIVKLDLWSSRMKQDPMPILEKLPRLRLLKMEFDAYEGTKLT